MFDILGKIGQVKEKMALVKQQLSETILEESEMDGTVIIRIGGDKVIREIRTSDEFYSKYSKEEREDMLCEALNNAYEKAEAHSKSKYAEDLQGMMPNIPGLDLGSMGF